MASTSNNASKAPKIRLLSWSLFGGLFVLNFLYKIHLVTSYAPDHGGFERNVIWGIQTLAGGNSLYSSPESAPFAIVQYMPLYYRLVAWIVSAFQVDPTNAHGVYICARGINLLFCLLSTGVLLAMAKRIFKVDWLIAFGVSTLAFLWMEPFAISGRPDSMKACLFQLAVFTLLSFPKMRKRYAFPLALVLSCSAFLAKQDGLVFCGILPLALLFQGDRKGFFAWSLLYLAALSAFLLICISWIGPAFLPNVLGGLENGISISWFIGSFGNYFGFHSMLFGLGLVLAWEFCKSKSWHLNVLSAAMICAFVPQVFASLKYGSAPNYFLEALLISLLMLGIWLDKLPSITVFQNLNSRYAFVLISTLLTFYIPSIQWVTAIFLNQEAQLKSQYENQKDVAVFVRSLLPAKNWVLVDLNRQWEDHLTTLLFDKVVAPQRDVILQVALANGKIRMEPFKKAMADGTVSHVITEVGGFPGFLGTDASLFKPMKVIGAYQVWEKASL